MATTASHATTAADLLAGTPTNNAALAASVHAVLSKSSGTGADYTAAEAALDAFTAGGAFHDYAVAIGHAHLA